MAYLQTDVTKVTTRVLQNMKLHGEKIAMLTAYDYSMAKLVEQAGIEVILVGDSAKGFASAILPSSQYCRSAMFFVCAVAAVHIMATAANNKYLNFFIGLILLVD
jgi:ketopantoate hydroxymethyltransferase